MTVRLPMRFQEVGISDAQPYLDDDRWVAEQKFDGTRALAVITPGSVEYRSGRGGPLAHSAATQHLEGNGGISDTLLRLLEDEFGEWLDDSEIVLDGEIMIDSGEYRVFDVPYLRFQGQVLLTPVDPFEVRRAVLDDAELRAELAGTPVSVVRQARGHDAKESLLVDVATVGGEGVMLKYLDGMYKPGARVNTVLKVKFVKTADVIVTHVFRPDPRHGSISFAVREFDADGSSRLVDLGACSAIGKPAVKPGDVIEVAYLYRSPSGGGLVQPRMVRVRDDKEQEDCTFQQFPAYSRAAV